MEFDVVIKGGTIVTAAETARADVGIIGEPIVALGTGLTGQLVIDAGGRLVMPGGVDSHCHVEQLRAPRDGRYGADEDSFVTGSTAALAGGTTTIVTFAAQFKGAGLLAPMAEYRRRAGSGAMVDYAFHQIITDPSDTVLNDDLPQIVAGGVRSFKVFMTYDASRLDDRQVLRVLAAARRLGALVTVHCENYDAIAQRTAALLAAGLTAPKYHAWARPPVVEREATHRAIALAELMDQPIQVFHVSCAEAAEEVARARARGLKVWAETCPQYLYLTAADMDRPGFEGAKFICSPALRSAAEQEALWGYLQNGTLGNVSSDHSASSFDGPSGKRVNGEAPFSTVPNGVPGLTTRLPLLFSAGVAAGRISASDFVRLTASAPAALFGLADKGSLMPGADADITIWDPERRVTITQGLMQHAVDYTPYEGVAVTGWPTHTIRRGSVVMRDGQVSAEPGSGRYLPVAPYDLIRPRGVLPDGFDASAYAV